MYIQISGQVRDLISNQVQDYVRGQTQNYVRRQESNQIFIDLHNNLYGSYILPPKLP